MTAGRVAMAAALLLALLAGAAWLHARSWAPDREQYPVQGVSVSAANGTVDWGTVAANGADFAYVQVADGVRRDPAFTTNWSGARAAGLRYGAALTVSLCRPPAAQATHFITTVPRDRDALPPVLRLDFQRGCAARPARAELIADLDELARMIENHAGKPAILNVSRPFDDHYDIGSGINRTLWLDRDFLRPDYASHGWVMWTANAARHIDGVDGPVRWDVVAP